MQPDVPHHPGRDSVGPPAGRQRSDRPGQVQGEARAQFSGSEPGREDPCYGVRGVLGSDSEEPEGGFRRGHFRSHQTQGQEGQEDETVRQARKSFFQMQLEKILLLHLILWVKLCTAV